mmetsp:Transcript_18295/g.55033  ORF Transcript_18295/g.55033 Transcript_18295/m.55033 type:complete len:1040 (-) Transcript_18295:2548-5667(-)|eukprot:CAMPEP_0206144264 /NCGR_PEP_ID=MMETSP1473-20131121/23529_1 /ASSEMBLY_ACC=CAM_ASM_001109 /TAXON_ID=1461547 /ORGANISM="Stichococcus sp, Strain RCC1054" /LENGTH=1039 /DNA_ID=CAMNT_0053540035 /DNA_START=76 /DNA_END=3195 /DNA_ORIENTATION=-
MASRRGATAIGALLRRTATMCAGDAGAVSQASIFSTSQTSRSLNVGRSFQIVPTLGAIAGPFAASTGSKRQIVYVSKLQPSDVFAPRHNSAGKAEVAMMVEKCGFKSMDELIDATVPSSIRREPMQLGQYNKGFTESGILKKLRSLADKNKVLKSYIGMGYYDTFLPPVIQRNLLENPGWYTQYTPYQAEIAQGRLESLLNFQTMVADLTGMELSNSSLLDEGTAAAEAMTMCSALGRSKKDVFLISNKCFPQTIAVCQTRADGLGLKIKVVDEKDFEFSKDVCGAMLQYPASDGSVLDYSDVVEKAHSAGSQVVVATDLLALCSLKPPGEWGADIVIGSAQRFGVPMGYGGPHASFLATSDKHKRIMPGRIIGISKDAAGQPALRMAMQTREQHIRRDKATSNICTAQALLANISAMYAVYHGPEGLKRIANRVHGLAAVLASGAEEMGLEVGKNSFFDTVCIKVEDAPALVKQAVKHGVNLRLLDNNHVTISLDETTSIEDVNHLLFVLNGGKKFKGVNGLAKKASERLGSFKRNSRYLQQPIFNLYHSEHEMLRYLKRLENRDLSLCHSMIALGSCTMKLNATSEMMAITWPEFASLHPFVPQDQAAGYIEMFEDLAAQLTEITGFDKVSLQPNAGASGEYAGLMAIRAYHRSRGDAHRNICIIPTSAHGTNPASAIMVGMKIVPISTDAKGNIDIAELKEKAEQHKDNLAALMITYPSTHGVYEEGVDDICNIIHANGGQVYMDGANMNAQVGLTSPGHIGADVCHLNLHKTFCIPHGGGGPGMGPIGVKEHLAPFLPSHPLIPTGAFPDFDGDDSQTFGPVAAAPFGSSLILPISYAYIAMMGSEGLTEASKRAILNANYMAARLEGDYKVLFTGKNGTCAHEFILDLRKFEETAGIKVIDVSKRLIDYGYHSPTMSWPVNGTLMIEPTESESKAELDRLVNALIAIRGEIRDIEEGRADKDDNVLKNAPHPAQEVMADEWNHPYSRELAAFPAAWVRQSKFWPAVKRIDDVYGDRHLVSTIQENEVEPQAATV